MKSIKTLALVAGLLGLSGVSQAQFSSTWTAASDYDFRGVSQTGNDPTLQASLDYAFADTGWSVGAWASNVDFGPGVDEDIELDLYANYAKEINDTFTFTAGGVWYEYPSGSDFDGMPEVYAGFNAGDFSFKQWYSWDYGGGGDSEFYTDLGYTYSINDAFSLGFHVGYVFGDAFDDNETVDFSVQANYAINNFTLFAKFTGTDASGEAKVDENEPRFLVGVTTTLPWGE